MLVDSFPGLNLNFCSVRRKFAMKIGHNRKDIKNKEETPASIEEKKTFFGSIIRKLDPLFLSR